ncbi:FAD/NAD(P)-binding domain-containing protein [Acephala macrosclerotiorum]|nr:FAD/NAD(P)-binding domain-containing protein [Acephala macrosclerotiorum]
MGESQSNGEHPSSWVPIWEQPIFTPRKLRVVCVGAGYSGLMLAYYVKVMNMESCINLCIYEKNSDIGGVWFENRYPGAAYDVPAQILAYIKRTAAKYGLDKPVKLNSKVIESVNQNGIIIEDEADVLVNTSGVVNKWKMPSIEGLSDYKGKLVHSANWDETFDWAGKKVAVIGNGESGCQTVPHLQAKASKLVHFFRQPTWIIPNLAVTGLMRNLPNNDEALIKQLIPDFPIGCRRITPNNGYLQAIQAPNASFSMAPILRITETGIETTKGEEDFDLIVCATGFDNSFRPYWPVTGKNGVSLNEKWNHGPQAYMGICAPDMPNYFMFVGPNSLYAHGDSLPTMEWTAEYILKWRKKIATMVVKHQILDDFNISSHEFLRRTVWAGSCRMWWKEGSVAPDGKIIAMYAGSVLHFKGENFEIEYNSKNRFRFVGNGLSVENSYSGDID